MVDDVMGGRYSGEPFRYLAGRCRRHPWNESFDWQDHDGPFTTLTPEQVRQFDEEGFVVVPDLVDADTLAEVREDLDRLEAEVDAFLQTREDGRFSITETGALTIAIHAVTRSEKAQGAQRAPGDPRPLRRPHRPRRPALLGPGGVQEDREAAAGPVAPGQRLHVRRAAGVPHRVARAHRRHRGERLPGGGARRPPPRHPAAPLHRPARLGVPGGGHAVGEGAGGRRAARWCSARSRRTAPARTSPTRSARRTSSSTAHPTRRSCEANRPRGPRSSAVPCTAPERQYEVLRGGEPVPA